MSGIIRIFNLFIFGETNKLNKKEATNQQFMTKKYLAYAFDLDFVKLFITPSMVNGKEKTQVIP